MSHEIISSCVCPLHTCGKFIGLSMKNQTPRKIIIVAVVALNVCGTMCGAAAGRSVTNQVEFPSTSGGELARQFVSAINSLNEQPVRDFVAQHVPAATGHSMTPEKWEQMMLKLQKQSSGLELKKVMGSSETSATLLLESYRGAYQLGVEIRCDKTDSKRAAGLELHPMPSANAKRPKALPKEKIVESSFPEVIAQHVDETVALDLFSGVILVAKEDRVLLHKAWGMANKDANLTNRVDTRFGSASVGKMFTAVAIAQLVDQGKMTFEDTIGSVLPDYPNREAASSVTIHHLLTHSGGVADPFESPEFKSGFKAVRQSDWFPLFAMKPLQFKPGARHDYSNGGYVVLAAIIEKLSGQSFADYLCEHVFRPAQMTGTGCLAKQNEATTIAAPHRRRMLDDPLGIEPRRVNATSEFNHAAAGMGGWQTTTEDLFRFARAVRTSGLLSAATTAKVTTGKVSVFGNRVKYGYGFYDIEAKGDRMVGHSGGGGDLAVAGEVEMLWDSGYTVVILSNYDLEETRRLALDILRFLRGQHISDSTKTPTH